MGTLTFLLIAMAINVCLAEIKPIDIITKEWEVFKSLHSKSYSKNEDYFRLKIFMENKHKIATHNVKYQLGQRKFMLRMNYFGDMLHHEFIETMNGLNKNYHNKTREGSTYLSPQNVVVPDSMDWREHGYVTPVKNQGQCGSCWAFSTTGSLEGQHFRKTKKLISLSEQNLVDCSSRFGNNGCNGGLMDNAFQYIKKNKGLDTEKSYPYEAMDGNCRYNSHHKGATDSGFVDVAPGNETQLQEAVATVGPVSIAIDASQQSFQFYSSGVYDEPECSSEELDHGVLVVGYGTDPEGQDFWLVKNSWGESWGMQGYIKMSRNKDNQCGIASQASYPLV